MDVAMELPDKERLAFYDAIMQRQFYGIEPNLTGMAKLAYISQKHNTDSQVKGWEDKTQLKLTPIDTPTQGGSEGGGQQEKEKEKEKEKEELFEQFWDMYDKKEGRKDCVKKFMRLPMSDIDKIFETLPKYIASTPDKKYRKLPETYLNGEHWHDEIAGQTSEKRVAPDGYYYNYKGELRQIVKDKW